MKPEKIRIWLRSRETKTGSYAEWWRALVVILYAYRPPVVTSTVRGTVCLSGKGSSMERDDYQECDVSDTESIKQYVGAIQNQDKELVLLTNGKTVGAILTPEQYEWFLDQLDAQQDLSFVDERSKDREGSQDLDDFKKEIGE